MNRFWDLCRTEEQTNGQTKAKSKFQKVRELLCAILHFYFFQIFRYFLLSLKYMTSLGNKNDNFWPKINVSANFSKSSHKVFLVLHIWTVFLVYLWNNPVNVPGKISFCPFCSFLGQKYIACGDKRVFLEVFGQFLPICWSCMVKFCYTIIFFYC